MKNIYSIYNHKETNYQTLITDVFNTYQKLISGYTFDILTEEDIQIMKNFYSYLTIDSSKSMLSDCHKAIAYEEMKSYVGNFEYPLEMKKVFLKKYLEYLEYIKLVNQNESLKFA